VLSLVVNRKRLKIHGSMHGNRHHFPHLPCARDLVININSSKTQDACIDGENHCFLTLRSQ